jgi:uncharacterized protein (AIM24 family)
MSGSGQGEQGGTYLCPWCGFTSTGVTLSCPACGAAVDVQAVVSRSGWTEMPPIPDMARLQFGRSTCQIEGAYVPVADMNLAPGDGLYFAHHVILWKDPQVEVSLLPLAGAFRRMLAGLPILMTQAQGPGHIAFSADRPGELIALPLHPHMSVDVREHTLLVATAQVRYDWFSSNVWFVTGSGNDKETHYPVGQFMDRFTAGDQPGLLLLHGGGNVFVRRLAQGETILVKPSALLYKEPGVQMNLYVEYSPTMISTWWSTRPRHLWLQLFGPGRVAVESAYGHFHDPGTTLSSTSPANEWRW